MPAFSGPETQTYPQSIELIALGIQRQLPPTWMRWDLSWQIDGSQIPLTKYSVQLGTHLLTLNQQEQRQTRYADWIRQISEQPCPPLSTALTPLWRTRLNNYWKESFWDVCLNGQLLADIQAKTCIKPCGCNTSGPMPGRQHHFLECPVATSIYNTIQQQLDEKEIPFLIWTVNTPPNFPKHI